MTEMRMATHPFIWQLHMGVKGVIIYINLCIIYIIYTVKDRYRQYTTLTILQPCTTTYICVMNDVKDSPHTPSRQFYNGAILEKKGK